MHIGIAQEIWSDNFELEIGRHMVAAARAGFCVWLWRASGQIFIGNTYQDYVATINPMVDDVISGKSK